MPRAGAKRRANREFARAKGAAGDYAPLTLPDLRIDMAAAHTRLALADAAQLQRAVAAARRASGAWRSTPPAERIRLSRKVAWLIEQRVYEIAAALSLEVGKSPSTSTGWLAAVLAAVAVIGALAFPRRQPAAV